eukprot:scaffold1793_cov173-Amphora_coffeaeformis.AAC.6
MSRSHLAEVTRLLRQLPALVQLVAGNSSLLEFRRFATATAWVFLWVVVRAGISICRVASHVYHRVFYRPLPDRILPLSLLYPVEVYN